MKLLGQIIQGDFVGLANLGGQLVRDIAGLLVGLGEQQRGLDGILHLFKGLGVGGLFVQDLDDKKCVLGLYEVGDAAVGKRKCRFLEFGNGLALGNPAQISTLVFGAGIFRVFLGQILEFRAFLGLFQNVF